MYCPLHGIEARVGPNEAALDTLFQEIANGETSWRDSQHLTEEDRDLYPTKFKEYTPSNVYYNICYGALVKCPYYIYLH